jgi:hypothetical protein
MTVVTKYRPTGLPSPEKDVGQKIFHNFRQMTHTDTAKGRTAVALGIRYSSIVLNVKIKK